MQHKVIDDEEVAKTRGESIINYKKLLDLKKICNLQNLYERIDRLSNPSDRSLGIFYGVRKNDGARVCLKRIYNLVIKGAAKNMELESKAITEAFVLHNILTDHPFVVKLNHVYRDIEQTFWMEFDWISPNNALSTTHNPAETWNLIRDVSLALSYCHSHDVVHCDIKLDNIMRHGDRFVLIDFGSANFVSQGIAAPNYEINPVGHRPPEILLQLYWNDRVDIWSLACSAVEFYCMARLLPHPFLYDVTASAETHLLTVASLVGHIPAVMTTHLHPGFVSNLKSAANEKSEIGLCPQMTKDDGDLAKLIEKMMAPLPQDRPSATNLVLELCN